MKKLLPLLLIIVLVAAYIFYQQSNKNKQTVNQTTNGNLSQNNQAVSPSPSVTEYSLTEVGQHNSKEDCWLVIEGKVYDVSAFIKSGQHPGGDAILQGCGKDATVLFNTRPMGSKTPHSERARMTLANFLIGSLKQ